MSGSTNWRGLVALALVFALGCGPSAEEKRAAEAQKEAEQLAKNMEEAGKQVGEAAAEGGENLGAALEQMGKAMGGGEGVEPVDFRDLKALLPESVAGLAREDASGEKSAAFGVKVSLAEAEYSNDQGNTIHLKITDTGTMKGIAAAAYAWAYTEFDRETDSGYEQTMKFEGHRAFEKFDSADSRGELHVIVADRFIVEGDSYGVKMDDLKSAVKQVDLGKLAAMKSQGIN